MFKIKNLLVKVTPEGSGTQPCPTPTCGGCTCTDDGSFCDFPTYCTGCSTPTECRGESGCRPCTEVDTQCTACTHGCTICTDGCTQPTIRGGGRVRGGPAAACDGCTSCTDGCTACTDGCTACTDGCTSCTDGCTACTDGCTSCTDGSSARVAGGEVAAGRLARLTALRTQLRRRLADVEEEAQILERGLEPRTLEEVEALEAQLDDAKAALAERRAELEQK
ncbi:MAG: hypothetical protein AAGD06_29805 [Acidobacteriota bacterium]